jgi:hypothetical protein
MIRKNTRSAPLKCGQVRRLRPRPPLAGPPQDLTSRVHSAFLTFEKNASPRLDTRLERISSAGDRSLWRLDIDVGGRPDFKKSLQPRIEHRVLSRKAAMKAGGPVELRPFLPDFAGLHPIPDKARLPRRRILKRRTGERIDPLYVFSPDGRYVYNDHNYPWSCAGQINNNGWISSGVLVGPRHVLTASHSLDWNAPWAVFNAHHYGNSNLAVGFTWCVWYYEKLGSVNSDNVDMDYAVCVLDQPLGNWLGWFGSKTYNDDWDDEPYWAHCGYGEDIGNANYPTFQQDICLEEEDGGNMKAMSSTTGDFTHAHSGGPVFGWWDGPYVVGVVSGQAQGKNWISGGVSMVRLIKEALAQTP